jgi:TolB protein
MLKRILFLFAILSNYLFAIDASMEIVKQSKNLPIVHVNVSSNNEKQISIKTKNILKQDLMVSGHFNTSDARYNSTINSLPNFITLEKEKIDLYVNAFIKSDLKNGMSVHMKLYDVNSKRLILDKIFNTTNKVRYPFISHKMAISINEKFNAPTIKWMDNFVVFSKYTGAKKSEIIIADYTLTYQKIIVKGGLNIFPKWENAKQNSFYYTSYKNDLPILIKQNIYTGKKTKILKSEGMIVCSDVSMDGSKLLLTMAPNSQPDIYLYDLKQKVKTRITKYKGIDVGGHFVENDTKVVFVSDRLKYPNIFAKSINSRGVERLVYHGRNNSSCTTYKNYIVYSSRETNNEFGRNSFNLYLISTRSDFIRRLTTTGLNQFPKFSSDGETILFIKRYNGKSSLNLTRLNYNKSFSFPLKSGKLQSIDW